MSDGDDDISGLKDQISSISQSLSELSDKVAGVVDAEHTDDEHLVSVTGDLDTLKKQIADDQAKLEERLGDIEKRQQAIMGQFQTLEDWWNGIGIMLNEQAKVVVPGMPHFSSPV